MVWIVSCLGLFFVFSMMLCVAWRGRAQSTDAPRNSADRLKRKARQILEAKHELSSGGWKISNARDITYEFSASKGRVEVYIYCFDKSDEYYKSKTQILDGMESSSRNLLAAKNRVSVFYTNMEFPGLTTDALVRRGIFLFRADDLGILSAVSEYEQDLPTELDPRLEGIFQRHQNFSLFLSRRFFDAGNKELSLIWARRAVAARPLGTARFAQIFNHLRLINDLDGVEQFATEFCALHRTDVEALQAVTQFFASLKNHTKALEWATRLTRESPDNSAGYIGQAVAHEGLGNNSEALACITKATTVGQPDSGVLEAAIRIARKAAAVEFEKQWSLQLQDLKKEGIAQ